MIVFFDLDGTIVDNSTQIIPDSAVEAIRDLGKNGHIPVLNTGRLPSHVDPRVREIPFEGWICGCGMEISCRGQQLRQAEPGRDACRAVIDAVRSCGMQVFYESRDGILTDGPHSTIPRAAAQLKKIKARGLPVLDLSGLPEPRFQKFITHDAPGCRRAEFDRRTAPYFTPVDRGSGMTEWVMAGCTKAGGMKLMADYLGIPREQTVAVGDSTNDLPMLEAAGYSICMGNGMPQVKAMADFVTSDVLDHGIRRGLAHCGLI